MSSFYSIAILNTKGNQMEQKHTRSIIRGMVRSTYDLQQLRIQTGNRVVAVYKQRMGILPVLKKDKDKAKTEDEKLAEKVLKGFQEDYYRITDGIANKLSKNFEPGQFITCYSEAVMVSQYIRFVKEEETGFKQLTEVLKTYPLYTEFLSKVDGLGPQISGVLISEIDIYRAKYASSLWMLAGLDVITVGEYTDSDGNKHILSDEQIRLYYEEHGIESTMKPIVYNGYLVTLHQEGRTRKKHALVTREYTNRDGETDTRQSITFNPWLKT